MKHQTKVKQNKALLEMNRILGKNFERLAEAASEKAKAEIEVEQRKLKSREKD